ncbi:hypothetical protein N0V82_004435 [Gnomoniopsis sp. IMI 355080]|nr:hypothetical protein N0V82_004435 [Gnomoniopsis sp. IMI 355080]
MKMMMLLLSLVSLLASLAIANIERSCNCIDDICIDHQGFPPGNTSCFFNIPTDASDTDTSDSDGYAYQACGNASYADLSGVSEYGITANISNCIWILEDLANSSFVFLASQLYNTSALAIASYGDCYLWVLGGANATAELTDVDDTFFVGNMDLVFAMGNSIINYGNDNSVNSNFSVCGTIPNCNFYST